MIREIIPENIEEFTRTQRYCCSVPLVRFFSQDMTPVGKHLADRFAHRAQDWKVFPFAKQHASDMGFYEMLFRKKGVQRLDIFRKDKLVFHKVHFVEVES